jgi:hypothetical protein
MRSGVAGGTADTQRMFSIPCTQTNVTAGGDSIRLPHRGFLRSTQQPFQSARRAAAAHLLQNVPDMVCSSLRPKIRQAHLGILAAIAAVPLLAAPVFADEPAEVTRPAVLTSLEAAFAGLQVFDVHSTLRAISHGGVEANPVMSPLVSSPAAVIASKAAVTLGVFYVSEKLWHRHKVSAILTLLALDSGYAMIAAHNYALERRTR